ncbi:GFA family protein [Neorhizobium alkalisoli]|uniref:CENP-V/GFA domain-containing protein n=1 Tax=Neorhizobium alkalisoli TaxID=528178 RepID=A0A561QBU8_9HYPH|nr:GFA family protein [Neorhizobium alkalisoli]TWF47813.1 hypothetical protein FHW37_110110 [Neorhizobium alkalisoli]
MVKRLGGCLCGKVTYSVEGMPIRVGICHCTDCRQESGSAFTYFGIWPASAFETSSGETHQYAGRQYCRSCGSRLFACDAEEAEIKLGSLQDAPTGLAPTYELWIKRREPWLPALPGAEQFDEDRTQGGN